MGRVWLTEIKTLVLFVLIILGGSKQLPKNESEMYQYVKLDVYSLQEKLLTRSWLLFSLIGVTFLLLFFNSSPINNALQLLSLAALLQN